MKILGLSFDFHESAAALVVDGRIIAAAQEERFSRRKHDASFPRNAAAFCLGAAGIGATALDAVVFYENTMQKFDRIVRECANQHAQNPDYICRVVKNWIDAGKFDVVRRIAEELKVDSSRIHSTSHHLSHAASTFYCSPFSKATIVTMDGIGEEESATISLGCDCSIEKVGALFFPHSLGLFYSAFTSYLGFRVNDGEYKVMGMAGFGEPRYLNSVRELIPLTKDGFFELDMEYFNFSNPEEVSYTARLVDRFGPPRQADARFAVPYDSAKKACAGIDEDSIRFANIAASIQACTEEVVLHVIKSAIERTGVRDVCLAGGVALNCLANSRLQHELGCRLFIQPAAGDSGGALGAALAYSAEHERIRPQPLVRADLGQSYSDEEILSTLRGQNWTNFKRFDNSAALVAAVADLLHSGAIIGWLQGGFEWGPRALGHRSILANPTLPNIGELVNVKIKFREPFRPFAPSVVAERAHEYFELPDYTKTPVPENFMLSVHRVRSEMQHRIPAVTHVDGTARTHLVERAANALFYDLLVAFGERSGVPMLVNTSFNLQGEPIVNSPFDALSTFTSCDMDYLVMGSFVLSKDGQ